MPFELHEAAEVQALANLLDPRIEQDRRCIILSGKPGGGRSSLLGAALRRLRSSGQAVLLGRIDLDGFEPDLSSPTEFAAYLQSKSEAAEPDASTKAFAERLTAASPIRAEQAALLAIVAGRDNESEALVQLAGEALESGGVRWERLVADPLQAPVVIHVADSSQLPVLLRLALLQIDVPGLVLVISCDPAHGSEWVVRKTQAARFELMPMDEGEVRSWLRARLGETVAEQSVAFSQACVGSRELLALLASQQQDGEAPAPPVEALNQLTSSCDEDRRKTLQVFLVHAALCGENVPVKTILEYLGVEADEIDDWTDLIDESVGDDSDVRLFGSRFQHPGFAGEIVYGFREAGARERLRLAASNESRIRMAQQFAAWLFQNRPVVTRAAARLLVELCFQGGIDGDRIALERELAWWAGDADLNALRELLIKEARPQEEIWTAVNAVQTLWPPQRTLALLDAAKQVGVTRQAEGALHAIRAGLLIRLQRFEEAAESVELALGKIGEDPLLETVLLEQRGSARRALGREAEAFADFERCRAIRLELLAAGDNRVVPLLQRSLLLLRQAGRTEEAAAVEQALAAQASATPV